MPAKRNTKKQKIDWGEHFGRFFFEGKGSRAKIEGKWEEARLYCEAAGVAQALEALWGTDSDVFWARPESLAASDALLGCLDEALRPQALSAAMALAIERDSPRLLEWALAKGAPQAPMPSQQDGRQIQSPLRLAGVFWIARMAKQRAFSCLASYARQAPRRAVEEQEGLAKLYMGKGWLEPLCDCDPWVALMIAGKPQEAKPWAAKGAASGAQHEALASKALFLLDIEALEAASSCGLWKEAPLTAAGSDSLGRWMREALENMGCAEAELQEKMSRCLAMAQRIFEESNNRAGLPSILADWGGEAIGAIRAQAEGAEADVDACFAMERLGSLFKAADPIAKSFPAAFDAQKANAILDAMGAQLLGAKASLSKDLFDEFRLLQEAARPLLGRPKGLRI